MQKYSNYKKKVIVFVVLILTMVLGFAIGVYANTPIKIVVNGKDIACNPAPFVKQGTTYVPLRAVAEALGEPVQWDGKSNSVIIGVPPEGIDLVTGLRPFKGAENSIANKPISVCGTSYSNGYQIFMSSKNVLWNLNGNFTTLTFAVASSDKEYGGPHIEVLGDNKVLDDITGPANSPPQDVVIDVTGVQVLKISGSSGSGYILNPRVK